MRGRASLALPRRVTPVLPVFYRCFATAAAAGRFSAKPPTSACCPPSQLRLRRRGVLARGSSNSLRPSTSLFALRCFSSSAAPSSIFVRFQPTPNDACYKFYVDDMTFLPPGTRTMMFDSTNSYQSPLAHALLEALPMVEEVTVGRSFVTVRRVEETDAKAAARFFAMKFHGVRSGQEMDESAAAARSQALQQRVESARYEDEHSSNQPSSSPAAPTSSGFAAEPPIELGGFTVSPSAQDEQIDESAIEALIAATDWSELKFHVSALLTDHISSGSPHVDPSAPNPHADTVPEAGDSEVVLMIKELVATTIRPQLQDDGGDLRFVGFDAASGEMRVELLGACRACKSSKTTLVDLIERTTRHWIPEVTAVKDVSRVASLYRRVAEDAMAEAENGPSAAELLLNMETPKNGKESDEEASNTTVQFTASAPIGVAGNGYRVVREVKASAREPLNAITKEAAVTASPSPSV